MPIKNHNSDCSDRIIQVRASLIKRLGTPEAQTLLWSYCNIFHSRSPQHYITRTDSIRVKHGETEREWGRHRPELDAFFFFFFVSHRLDNKRARCSSVHGNSNDAWDYDLYTMSNIQRDTRSSTRLG